MLLFLIKYIFCGLMVFFCIQYFSVSLSLLRVGGCISGRGWKICNRFSSFSFTPLNESANISLYHSQILYHTAESTVLYNPYVADKIIVPRYQSPLFVGQRIVMLENQDKTATLYYAGTQGWKKYNISQPFLISQTIGIIPEYFSLRNASFFADHDNRHRYLDFGGSLYTGKFESNLAYIGYPGSPYILVDYTVYWRNQSLTSISNYDSIRLIPYEGRLDMHYLQVDNKRYYGSDYLGEFEMLTFLPSYNGQAIAISSSMIFVGSTSYPRNNMTEEEIITFVKTLSSDR
ncbi:MAG: hypothetical protein NZL83_04895 [Candidatus Absconditabacterales bacterium]|nr:hypothetical protein [Candidatus Absconditabacterales bacterium]